MSAALILIAGLGLVAAPDTDLVDAYKKEFAFLEAEKKALVTRLAEVRAQAETERQRGETELAALEAGLLAARSEGERLQDRLDAAEREAEHGGDGVELFADTLARARSSLGLEPTPSAAPTRGDGEPGPEAGASPAAVDRVADFDRLVEAGLVAARESGAVRREPGAFFAADGRRVEGELVHLGRIASYGVAPGVAGALAPAGEGRLKLWPADTEASARALGRGETPAVLRAFVYGDASRAVEVRAEKTALERVGSGGVIGWAIVVMGLAGLLLVAVRGLALLGLGRGLESTLDAVLALASAGRLDEARAAAARGGGAVGRVLTAVIGGAALEGEAREDLVQEALLRELPAIERFGALITVLAAVAPLMGLLGTVTGMMSTFDVITEHGTGDPKLLAGGISEALVTTELGLVVAIPLLLLGTLLAGRAARLETALDRAALALSNRLRAAAPEREREVSP
jgi:biopolymer transport protein ExbB